MLIKITLQVLSEAFFAKNVDGDGLKFPISQLVESCFVSKDLLVFFVVVVDSRVLDLPVPVLIFLSIARCTGFHVCALLPLK